MAYRLFARSVCDVQCRCSCCYISVIPLPFTFLRCWCRSVGYSSCKLYVEARGQAVSAFAARDGMALRRHGLNHSICKIICIQKHAVCLCRRVASKMPLSELAKMSSATTTTMSSTAATFPTFLDFVAGEVQPLTDVFVPLDTIQPGDSSLVICGMLISALGSTFFA